MAKNRDGNLEPWEIDSVREIVRKSRWRRRSTSVASEEDLLQDCMLHWVQARQTLDFRSVRDPSAFMRRVLENKLRDLARHANSSKRNDESADSIVISIEQLTDESQPEELIADSSPVPVGFPARFERADAAIDLSRVFDALTPNQRALCYLLVVEGFLQSESGRILGISRTTTFREILRIRETFLEFGLENYLFRR